MCKKAAILKEINKKPEGSIISASKLYKERFANVMSEVAFAKTMSRLCESGEIARISRGVYCKAINTKYGMFLPGESDIAKVYTSNDKGMEVGYALYNKIGVTTQVPKKKEIFSSNVDSQCKQIGNVNIRKVNLKYTNETKAVIQLMELLYHIETIQDINENMTASCFYMLSKKYNDKVFDLVQKEIKYPRWVIASLKEVLGWLGIANSLDKYLSPFSKYRVPNMESIHEIARVK